MRRLLWVTSILAWALLGLAAQTTTSSTTKKKSTAKKSVHTAATASKKSVSTRTRTTSSKSGKKAPTRRVATRSRQMTPTPERYKEIQQALSAKGYLPAEQASGKWDDSSTAALKKFQADQNLDASGKINSLSLIALGLGPKHETPSKPSAPAPAPAQTPVAP
jgi:putative peptidoglycan binding protein